MGALLVRALLCAATCAATLAAVTFLLRALRSQAQAVVRCARCGAELREGACPECRAGG